MANRLFKGDLKTLEQGIVKLYGKVVTTTSGTIGSTSCKGFSVAKTGSEAGRYTVTLADTYVAFIGCAVTLVGAADAAYTPNKGLWTGVVRNISVADSTPTFQIQFLNPADTTDNLDVEVEDAAEFYLEITLKNSGAY